MLDDAFQLFVCEEALARIAGFVLKVDLWGNESGESESALEHLYRTLRRRERSASVHVLFDVDVEIIAGEGRSLTFSESQFRLGKQ